jgi:hypothetical protein
MKPARTRWRWTAKGRGGLAGAAMLVVLTTQGADETPRFGFTGPEIFPIDSQIAHLRLADLDGDGLQDLVVANNARSKISLLYNQTGKAPAPATSGTRKRELNELPPDARFRLDSIASEKRIASLVVTDLNRDGRPDLAYYGEPRELIVQYNDGDGGWSAPKRWPLEDGLLNPNALGDGDLNGDGQDDLFLLAENHLHALVQKPGGGLSEPEKIPYASTIKAAQVLDIDGDQRQDLLLAHWDSPQPFRFRRQFESGQLGPELYFSWPPIRSFHAEDLDGDGRAEIVSVAQKSGRAQVAVFTRKSAEPLNGTLRDGQFQVLPLSRTSKEKRGVVWVDVNGDGLTDLLVAEPEGGQLGLHLQQPGGGFTAPRAFPSLTGVSELAAADWDGDGRTEIFLLSADERQIGVTRLDQNNRIGFPEMLPTEGRPLAMAVGRLQPGTLPVLAFLLDREGQRELRTRTAAGQTTTQKLSESFKSNPSSLAFHDVNQDGHPDLVALIPYEKIKLLLAGPDQPFEEIDVLPPGGSAEKPWMTAADVDGNGQAELLLAQKNFVRAVVWQAPASPNSTPTAASLAVREQINGISSSSRIVGAAALPHQTNPVATIFLLDAERKALTLCERDATGVWQARRNLELPVSDFFGLQAIALGGTNLNAVAFLGLNAVAWKTFAGDVWDMTELDGYETPIKDGYLNDVVAGDLNQDGRRDLVFLETARNHLDLVTFEAPHRLVPANRWQVFEERTFRSRRSEMPEPREAVIGDLTGDGRNDLAILVHDRVLVYPQE